MKGFSIAVLCVWLTSALLFPVYAHEGHDHALYSEWYGYMVLPEGIGGEENITPTPTPAQATPTPTVNPQLQNRINELKEQIAAAQKKAQTLQGEINAMNLQISLTEAQIQNTQKKVEAIQEDINQLGGKIEDLNKNLDKQISLLQINAAAQYRKPSANIFEILFDTESVNDALAHVQYLQVLEDAQKRFLMETQKAKVSYESQKQVREEREEELKDLQIQLAQQKQQLQSQKSQKDQLLKDTRNDEREYQRQLEAALAEYSAIKYAATAGKFQGKVKKGEVIAVMGNSGYPRCSTGAHLHFEIQKNGAWVNPENYVKPTKVIDEQVGGERTVGSGDWDFPMKGKIRYTQHFGKTPWSWRYKYSGGIHTGMDLVAVEDKLIYAPADGELYSGRDSCGSNFRRIDHGNGVISVYLHVQ